jgi:DNA-binding XRE family transcriptional regulator
MAITEERAVSFSDMLRDARKRCGISQRALAKALRLSPSVICLWENGRRVPDVETLVSVAKVLKVNPSELLPGGGLPPGKYHCQWCDVPLERMNDGDYTCPKCHVNFQAGKVHTALYDELRKSFGVLGATVTPDRLAQLIDTAYVGNEVRVKFTQAAERQRKLCDKLAGMLSELEIRNPDTVAQILARLALTLERSGVGEGDRRLEGLMRYVERSLQD